LHVHGLVDSEVTDASYLVLSPEPSSGQFALTARDVKKETLSGHPLVLLAACDSGDTTTDLAQGHGLPEAFIEAGARAVLAVSARVKDPESEQFFRPLLASIQSGAPPAAALRTAREKWRREHGSSWADQVVLFE
jgi:cellulose synthase operon protein C